MKTKQRQKKVVLTGVTRTQAEEAFGVYASADAKQQRITSKMDIEITRIRERYATELSDLEDTKADAFEKLQFYAANNPDDFGVKKSIEMAHGVIGFRTGTPKVKTLKGFTWASVTQLLREYLPKYIRTVEEPAKDKIIADRDEPMVAQHLSKVGLCIDQDESFFVECYKEDVTV